MFCYILAEEPVQDGCLVLELVWKEDVEEDDEQQDPFKPEFSDLSRFWYQPTPPSLFQ